MQKKGYFILIGILLWMSTGGCISYIARYDGTYRGKVIDADTGEPIEGVVVLGTWYTEIPTVAGPARDYYDARETVTDKNGEFSIPGMGPRILGNLQPMRVLIFKAGYSYVGAHWGFEGYYTRKIVKWEGDKPIIPLRKLTMEERRKGSGPAYPPTEAPLKKVILMWKEINKNREVLGVGPVGPIDIWGGEKQ